MGVMAVCDCTPAVVQKFQMSSKPGFVVRLRSEHRLEISDRNEGHQIDRHRNGGVYVHIQVRQGAPLSYQAFIPSHLRETVPGIRERRNVLRNERRRSPTDRRPVFIGQRAARRPVVAEAAVIPDALGCARQQAASNCKDSGHRRGMIGVHFLLDFRNR